MISHNVLPKNHYSSRYIGCSIDSGEDEDFYRDNTGRIRYRQSDGYNSLFAVSPSEFMG